MSVFLLLCDLTTSFMGRNAYFREMMVIITRPTVITWGDQEIAEGYCGDFFQFFEILDFPLSHCGSLWVCMDQLFHFMSAQ